VKACFCRLQSGCLPAHLPTCLLSVVLSVYTSGLIVSLSVCFFFQFRLPTSLRFYVCLYAGLPACSPLLYCLSTLNQLFRLSVVCLIPPARSPVFFISQPLACLSVFPPANLTVCVPVNLLFY
jgi:hypothetical protein